ncbi:MULTISPECIES: DUF6801 domain-containing protein [unclassified Streptomyces]|uniref:DUF6801 domain-containing protein n=1 Tax=unclassified Streptomyces TaxID=2593676 RepID=UPI0006F78B9E|nr:MULTISPECIES: DUF6801 domain-containing protein [unclassified Streptomyces]KQX57363.1 hypothetical protein ASD33_27080 [Streptomyces sp. Root1304]KRA98735.1 hypothetical protein ASE09_23890 [Streptomyces sp. Root66D1]
MRGQRAALRTSRAPARGAAIAALVALAPLLPAAAVALGSHEVDAEIPYLCTLPSGPQPATVRIRATLPERAAVGEEIRPTDVTTTLELPAAAVADLVALKAATVRAETQLTVGAAQNGQATEAVWRGTAEPLAVPAEGPLALTTTGDVPILTTDTAGDLALTAGGLAVDLAPSTADGAATTPAALSVGCVPGQDAQDRTRLATVPVGTGVPGGEPSTPPASPSGPVPPSSSSPVPGPDAPTAPVTEGGKGQDGTGGTTDGPAGKGPQAGPQVEDGAKAADANTPGTSSGRRVAPPCVTEKPTPTSLSAYITGYSNVRKLNGASLIPLSCVQIEQGTPEIEFRPDGTLHLVQKSVGGLSYQGRQQSPPFESTFLTFGFAPVTATMVLEQTGPMSVESDILLVFPDNIAETYIRVPLVLRVLDVRVNGTRLDVGPSCRTAKPITSPEPQPAKYPGDHMVLLGKGQLINGTDATGYVLTGGGPLTGEVDIPAFKGCGAGGENLDRLLTASISGSGNYIKQTQGQTCAVGVEVPTEGQCTEDRQPYVVPKPER